MPPRRAAEGFLTEEGGVADAIRHCEERSDEAIHYTELKKFFHTPPRFGHLPWLIYEGVFFMRRIYNAVNHQNLMNQKISIHMSDMSDMSAALCRLAFLPDMCLRDMS